MTAGTGLLAANCIVTGLFAPLAQSQPSLDFYATAAEVLPVLLLALAFEFRGAGMVFLPSALLKAWLPPQRPTVHVEPGVRIAAEPQEEGEPPPWWASAYTALVALALFLGEATALGALLGVPERADAWIVGTVLGIGGVAILGPALFLQLNVLLRAISRPIKNLDQAFVHTVFALLAFVLGLLALVGNHL